MIRVGLHLSLHSGRTALTRLVVTVAAVGVGVGLLLSVMAIYHGYETTAARACWACTGHSRPGEAPPDEPGSASIEPAANAELWQYTLDFYGGQQIERADIAALGPQAPVVPGLSRLPGPGEYYASPALARLMVDVPKDELADRFPGTQVGLIGAAGLSGPDDLAIVVGRTSAELAGRAIRITAIETRPEPRGDSSIYRFGFALGAVAVLLPMLLLIGNATRLAAARRQERFAAMRLVGATPRQVTVIASVDAVVGAALGSLLGVLMSAVLQPLAASISITGSRFFPQYVTPTLPGYAVILLGVPGAAALAAVLTLRRVRISPLGVARRATPPPPRAWRIVPLLVGLVVFIVPLALSDPNNPSGGQPALGLALTMVGLVIGGSWLTGLAARLLARFSRSPAALLASRRMADDPRGAFRSVSGLVLAVFVGTFFASVVPAALAAEQAPTATALDNVLRLPVSDSAAATIIADLRARFGTAVLPIHAATQTQADPLDRPPPSIVECADLTQFAPLGHCAPGVGATTMVADALRSDNVAFLDQQLPLVTPRSAAYTGDPSALPVHLVLVNVSDHAALERIRTYLAVTYPGLTGESGNAAQTFGEVAQIRATLYTELRTVAVLVVGLTLVVAGCGLAIAMGGGIVDRRRPFTLLRVSGTPSGVLRRVVLLESLVPLLTATVAAVATGLATAAPVNRILSPTGASTIHLPDHTYYLTMAAGLATSIAVIISTLPL
jgi:hypothetical protein